MKDAVIVLMCAAVSLTTQGAESPYLPPHAPPTQSAFLPLPPGAVEPQGWLGDWCEQVRDGFTGRMEEVHPAFKQAWAADYQMTGQKLFWDHGGWPYEGGGYWFEGLTRLAHALHDEKLIAHAQRRFEPVIAGMRPDQGVLFFHWLDRNNPEQVAAAEGLTYRETEWPMWASGLFGRALVSHYEATRDPRALKALEMAYSSDPRWVRMGWAPSNLGPAYDTWTWTGNVRIKAAIDDFFAQGGTNEKGASSFNRYAKPPKPTAWEDHTDHVVHQIESTVWALGYLWTGKREFLDAQLAWHDHLERDGMLPYGVPVSDELTGPPGAARGSETCDVANFLWSQTFLLGIAGQGRLGDRTERAFFNAAPAVVTRDCRNHVYIQHPNRVVDAGGNASYRSSHNPLCCSAALNRMAPTYVTRMWMATPDQGLALVLHGPSRVRALVAKDVPVEIISRTAYPFEETIELTVNPAKAVAFPLSIRVPGWCTAPAINVAGTDLAVKPVDGFVRIQRAWKPGDMVRLHFPMAPRIETGRDVGIPANQRQEVLAPSVAARASKAAPYASVVYGPLLFSLPVAEGKDANTPDPSSAWQFALAGTTMKVERDPMPASWTWPLAAPLRLKVAAQAIDWTKATVLPGGLASDSTTTEIALVPHGCTKFRVSMFPVTESAWRALGGPELPLGPKPLTLRAGKGVTYASDLKWTKATAGTESVLADKNYKQQPLRLGEQAIPKGLWNHTFQDAIPADIVFDLQGRNFVHFRALVGLDALAGGNGSVQFQVLVDGRMKVETPVLRGESTQALDVDLSGAKEITLRVLNGGDGFTCDQAVWGLARFLEPGATDVVGEVVDTMQKTGSVTPGAAPNSRVIEVEWGFVNRPAVTGTVTVLSGTAASLAPLENDNGLQVSGHDRWIETVVPDLPQRRGVKITVEGGTDLALSLRTSIGNACVMLSDLERGPVLIPSMGLYLVKSGGPTASRFREQLAAKKSKTARQLILEAPEESHATAMAEVFGDNAKKLPAFPTPPYESPMQIEVPEQALTDHWRLGAWHLKRWCKAAGDDIQQVSIWRFRFEGMWDMPDKRQDYETTFAKNRPTCIAQESHEVIRALDMMGLHDVARGGLNHWLFAKEYFSNTKGSPFADLDGSLLVNNPGAGGEGYDMWHPTGHGLIMEAAAVHYQMTGNKEWFLRAAPRLKKACEWSLRQRLVHWKDKPRTSWGYGLQPPINFGDYGGASMFYMVNARFYNGLKSVATILAELGVEGAESLLKEIEAYRKDIVAAVDESAALTPVVAMPDGTYRRYIPMKPGLTSNRPGRYDSLMGFACLADRDGSIYAPNDPLVDDALDIIEQTIPNGITEQVGYEAHPRLYLLNDQVPLFLRSLYKEYAVLIRPWELEPDIPRDRKSPETPVGASVYEFFEHPGKWAVDKTFEEAVFLQRLRNLLVMEINDALWLARATPRAWLEQGKKINVKNAPTHFGTVSYQIVSDVDNGQITATIDLSVRKGPGSVVLRLRHPTKGPMKVVSVNGKPWTGFDKDKETITLKNQAGTVVVTAQY